LSKTGCKCYISRVIYKIGTKFECFCLVIFFNIFQTDPDDIKKTDEGVEFLNSKEIKLIKELLDLAIDTRTPVESDDTPFASMTNLLKKLEEFQGDN